MDDPTQVQSSDDARTQAGDVPQSEAGVWPPGSLFGPYRILGVLGQGGMGVVYRAEDTRMRRPVALKTIVGGPAADPSLAGRLQREVQALSKLRHPNIVTIHEVGGIGGIPYFAMELLRGETLRQLLDREGPLGARAAAKVVREVARALAYAHERGVVHRDLKPHNVMVERAVDAGGTEATLESLEDATTLPEEVGTPAQYRVVLTDFGLARDTGADHSLTVSGQILGTPSYMSPEQAEGDLDRVDALSDVFSLGAVFYELLTGHVPFSGRTRGEIVLKVCMSDPVRPRQMNRTIPRDIEVICLKAMDKERERRFANARAFAEDLDRFLKGESILSKPATVLERTWRKVRRNPLVTSLAGALLVAAVVAVGLVWRSRAIEARAREARERSIEELRTELSRSGRALVQAALARRALGDLKGMASFARDLDPPIDRLIAEAPALAEPWYYRGLMKRALGELEDAERCQDRAIELATATDAPASSRALLPLARYERGILRTMRCGTRASKAIQAMVRDGSTYLMSEKVKDAQARDSDLAQLRQDAVSDLTAAIESSAVKEVEGEAAQEVVRAYLAWLGAHPPAEWLSHLDRAHELDPYASDVCIFRAYACAALGDLDRAAQCLEEGYDADRGYRPALESLVRILGVSAQMRWSKGRDGTAEIHRALAHVDLARKRGLADPSIFLQEAILLLDLSRFLLKRKDDPRGTCERGVGTIDEILKADPRDRNALALSSQFHEVMGKALLIKGQDPTAEFGLAIQAVDRSLTVYPDDPVSLHYRGGLLLQVVNWKLGHGGDVESDLERISRDLERALEVSPSFLRAALDGAEAVRFRGEMRTRSGEDPTGEYRRAVELYDRALAIEPGNGEAQEKKASCLYWWAKWLASNQKEASEVARLGRAEYERIVGERPDDDRAVLSIGFLSRTIAEERRRKGEDPWEDWGTALAAYETFLRLSPAQMKQWMDLGEILESWGGWRESGSGDPTREFQAALTAYEKALAQAPGKEAELCHLGDIHWKLGGRMARCGGDPAQHYQQALDAYTGALRDNPKCRQALGNRGGLLHNLRRHQEAVDDLEAALLLALEDEPLRGLLYKALRSLAARHALASEGRESAEAPPAPVAPEEAARLRDLAFQALMRAAELKVPGAETLEKARAYESLRSDPRWETLLRASGVVR